ncbi:MAG TPA: hypothetical protein VMH83_00850 [Candidatus Acidoferrum sp.]|nr:hypothetical protein [Candidatus Acidoferrum sp.]
MPPLQLIVWTIRALIIAGVFLLCRLSHSGNPAFAFALTWTLNGLFLHFFINGSLRLPRLLVRVHRLEPVLYRWAGVGLVKWLVTTQLWLLVVGNEPPPKAASRHELLEYAERVTHGAEVCHGATFIVATLIAIFFVAFGHVAAAAWITGFNIALNGYPVMLQRANRWRIHQVRGRW